MNCKNLLKIEEGKIYYWDVRKTLHSLHRGTKKVKLLGFVERPYREYPLAEVKSIETGEVFECDPAWLQQDPEILKKKYRATMRYWKRTGVKPSYIYELSDLLRTVSIGKRSKYVLVPDPTPEQRNLVKAINNDGIVDYINVLNIKGLEDKWSVEQQLDALKEEVDHIPEPDDYEYDLILKD